MHTQREASAPTCHSTQPQPDVGTVALVLSTWRFHLRHPPIYSEMSPTLFHTSVWFLVNVGKMWETAARYNVLRVIRTDLPGRRRSERSYLAGRFDPYFCIDPTALPGHVVDVIQEAIPHTTQNGGPIVVAPSSDNPHQHSEKCSTCAT